MTATTISIEREAPGSGPFVIDEEVRQTGLRMAFALLRRWQCELPPQEIEGITDLAICEAAKRFDPERGSSFNTFVYYYIKSGLIKAVKHAVVARKAVQALSRSARLAGSASAHDRDDRDEEVSGDPDLFDRRRSETPETAMLLSERKQIIRDALESIGERHRQVLQLVYYQQMSPQSAARELGVTKSGLRSELSRAKDALYKQLESSGRLKAVSL